MLRLLGKRVAASPGMAGKQTGHYDAKGGNYIIKDLIII